MSRSPRHRRPLIEALEPRLLFSATADIAVFADGASDGQYLAQAADEVDLVSIYMPSEPLMMDSPTTDVDPQSDLPLSENSAITIVIFVDTAVENYATLVEDIRARGAADSVAIVYLDSAKDGIGQISDYLAGASGLSAIHIISHGIAGNLQLGTQVLNENNINQFKDQLAGWQTALGADADILLYGCDLAANQSGLNFLRHLSDLTGADVAASNDLTGNSRPDADWILEERIGTVETASLFAANQPMEWQGTLADVVYVSIPAANNQATVSSTNHVGQTFQYGGGPYTVDQIGIQLLKDPGAAVQTITVELRNDWHGGILATASISSASLTDTFQWVNFNFAETNLTVFTTYWIRISSSGTDGLVKAAYEIGNTFNNGIYMENGNGDAGRELALRIANSDGVNAAPTVANVIPNQSVTEGDALNYSFPSNSFNDPDGDNLSYTAKLANGNPLPAWLQFNQATRTFSGVADDGNVGTLNIRVTATDGNGQSVFDDFDLTVNNLPEAPFVVNPIPDQVASGFTQFTYQFPAYNEASPVFTDPDVGGSVVSYRATLADGSSLPGWLSFDSATRTFSGIPTNADAGTITIKLYGTDNTGLESATPDQFNIVISATANDAPVNTVPGAQSTNEDTALVFNLANGNRIQIADSDAVSGSVQVTLSVSNGVLTLAGTAGLSFTTGDGTNDATLVFTGTVANINTALATLTYTPTSNYNGADTLSIVTNDLGNSGTGGAKSDSDTVSITVNAVNDAPLNTVPGAQTGTEDTALVFSSGNSNQIQIADVDSGSSSMQVTLSVTNGTLTLAGVAGLSFTTGDGTADSSLVFTGTRAAINTALATLTFNPTANYNGAAVLSLTTSDLGNTGSGGTLTDTDNVNITINAANDAPTVANIIPNQNATEDAAFSFQFASNTFNDIDAATTLVYSAQLAGGGALPSWLSFNATTRTFSGTPLNANVGTVSIDVIASDGSLTVTDTFNIVVANTNDAPTVANAIPNQSATEDAAFNFQFASNTFNDIDAATTLVYSAQVAGGGALPGWLSFNATTRTFSGTPLNANVGTLSIDVIASDGSVTVTDTFDIVIANTNDAPTVANAIPDQNATEDVLFNFSFASNTFNDPDLGSTLTYSAELVGGGALPGWLSFDSATRTFSGTPTGADVDIDVEVIASDGTLSVSDIFNITITPVDDSPVLAIPIPNQNTTEDVAFNFQFAAGTFTDPDIGDVLTYSATMADGSTLLPWLSFDPATRTFSGTPANGDVGTISIKVTAADINLGPTASDTFDIVIANSNDAPTIANAIANQNATEDSAFNFTFAANTFTDQDVGNTLTYSAQLAGGGALPAWLSFDAVNRTFNGTPLNAHVGTVSIDVIASDGNGGSVTETFSIVVANTNDAPTVDNVIPNQNATEDVVFNFSFDVNTFSDVDGNTLSYSAHLVGGGALPAWLSFDSATRTFSGTPANGDAGTLSIDVTANDGNGGTVTDTFNIVIANTNDAPTVVITPMDYNAIEQVPINLHGTGISVADVDGDALTITLTGAGSNSNLAATVGTTGVVIVSGMNTNTLILSGTAAQLNDLFAGNNGSTLTYRLSGDTPVATRLLTISASDGSLSGNDTATINITAVNDGPANSVPGAQATNEDTALVFSAGNGNQIQIDDLDSGSSDLEVTLSVTNGTLTLAGVAGLTFTTGDGTADSSLVFRGTQTAINTALATLTFNPSTNFNGAALLTITTSDLGNTGTGGTLTDSDNINIAINADNDAPTVANPIPNQNATEDVAFNFQFAVGAFADADLDSLTYTAQLSGGGLPAWLSFDPLTRTFSGTPTNSDVDTITIEVTANDSNGGAVTDTFDIIVANSNDAPTVANAIPNQNATENSAFNFQIAANTFDDVDVGDLLGYTAQLTGGGALPAWLSFDGLTQTFSGAPTTADVGVLNVDVIASDGKGGTVTSAFTITVAGLGDTEYIDTGAGGSFNPVSSANQLGQSFSYNSAGATYTVNEISLYLARYDAAAPQTITVELRDAWNGAILASDSIPSSQISRDGFGWHSFNFANVALNDSQTYVIQVSSTGTDDLVLVSRNAGNTFADGAMIVNGVLDATGLDLAFKISKDDGANAAPVVDNPIADQTLDAELPFNLVVPANTFSDPDGNDTITYRAQLAGGGSLGWLTFNEATRTFAGTPHWHQAGTMTVELIATDNHGASTSDFFDIEVINTNVAPTVANPIPDQVATEDAAFSFQFAANTFADVDVGNTFTYSAELAVLGGMPPWLSFDAATRTFSGTPANGDVGTWTVEVTANDGFGGEVIDTFVITVANTNDVPTITDPIPDQNATEDAAFNFVFVANTFNDQDVGDVFTYTAQLAGGGALPAWLVFDSGTRAFSGTPTNSDVGTLTINVIANDGNGGTVTDTFNMVVANSNDAPTIANPIADQNATEDVAFSFQFAANTFSDIDVGDMLIYSAQLMGGGALPAWLSFDAATRTFSGTPTNADVGTINIDVIASDGVGGVVTETFVLAIANTNDAPTLANPIANQIISEDSLFGFTVPANTFADVDSGNTLTYSAQLAGGGALPSWLSFDAATRTFSGVPTNSDLGSVSIDVIASDGNGGTVSDTFDIVVNNVNDIPTVANPIADQNATEDIAFSFQFTANTFSDIDVGDTLIYSAQLVGGGALPAWLSFDAATRTFSGTPTNNDTGNLSIQIIASDGLASVNAQFQLTIIPVNDAPITSGLSPISNVEDAAGDTVDLFAAFSDAETAASQLQYSVVSNSNPTLVSSAVIDPVTGQLQLRYGANQFGSTDLIIRAQDAQGAMVETSLRVNIESVNDAPTSVGIADVRVQAGSAPQQTNLQNIFSDIEDGVQLQYLLIGNSNPAVATNIQIDSTTGMMTLAFSSTTGGESIITLRALDTAGTWVDTQFKVTVTAAVVPPVIPPVVTPEEPGTLPPTTPPITPPIAPPTAEIPVTNPPTGGGGGQDIDPLPPVNPDDTIDTAVPGTGGSGNSITGDDERAEFVYVHDKSSRDYERAAEMLRGDNVSLTTLTASTSLVSLISPDAGFAPWEAEEFDSEVRRIRAQMDEALEEEHDRKAVVAGLTFSVTTGLLVWSLRASSLLLTMMSMLPLWRGLDPLPILDEVNKKKKELEQQRKDREREDKSAKEVGYLFDHAQRKEPRL